MGQLIVGSRDLRPRFKRLDALGAESLVLFDACYSGDTARNIAGLVPRTMPLEASSRNVEESFDEAFRRVPGAHESLADEWPYQNPVYLSAAVRHEAAWDIPAERARAERPTIDGNAHGAFTDSLLRALRGDADLDQDGQIAYRELHNFLLQRLQRDGQTPQLHVHAEEIGTGPVLGRRSPERRIQPGVLQSSALRVRIDPPADEIVSLLRGEDGIVVTGGEFDLELRRRGHAIRAYHPSGALIDGTSMTTRAAVRLVRRRAEAHRITLVSYPQQDLHLDTSIEPVHGVYFRGDRLVATMRPDERAWLLLLAIDAGGGATVLYAQHREDSRPIAAGELVEAVRVQAAAPYGTDLLEAFAWRDKPTGYDYWAGEDGLLKEAQLKRLLVMLQDGADRPGRAHESGMVFTAVR